MKPNFEAPLDTAKQLVEKNIILYKSPGSEIWKELLLDSAIPEYNILGENLIIADDWDHYFNMSEHDVIGAGTHAHGPVAYLEPYHVKMGRWHRSKEKMAGNNPFAGYLTNKKWNLNEVKVKDD